MLWEIRYESDNPQNEYNKYAPHDGRNILRLACEYFHNNPCQHGKHDSKMFHSDVNILRLNIICCKINTFFQSSIFFNEKMHSPPQFQSFKEEKIRKLRVNS